MGRQRGGKAGTAEQYKFQSAVDMARALPHHFRQISDLPKTLTDREQESLAQCRAAVDTLQWAFWLAGKALQIIRDGRLYRAECESFEDYVWKHWRMKKAYANKLIRTWKIAEQVFELASNGLAPIGAAKDLNQAQVWELVPVADSWGVDAAAFVYRTAIEVDSVTLTANVLKGTVESLPPGDYDPEAVAEHVRAYLASINGDGSEDELDVTARAEKAVSYSWVRRLVKKDRDAASEYLDAIQRQIDKCRAELLADQNT